MSTKNSSGTAQHPDDVDYSQLAWLATYYIHTPPDYHETYELEVYYDSSQLAPGYIDLYGLIQYQQPVPTSWIGLNTEESLYLGRRVVSHGSAVLQVWLEPRHFNEQMRAPRDKDGHVRLKLRGEVTAFEVTVQDSDVTEDDNYVSTDGGQIADTDPALFQSSLPAELCADGSGGDLFHWDDNWKINSEPTVTIPSEELAHQYMLARVCNILRHYDFKEIRPECVDWLRDSGMPLAADFLALHFELLENEEYIQSKTKKGV